MKNSENHTINTYKAQEFKHNQVYSKWRRWTAASANWTVVSSWFCSQVLSVVSLESISRYLRFLGTRLPPAWYWNKVQAWTASSCLPFHHVKDVRMRSFHQFLQFPVPALEMVGCPWSLCFMVVPQVTISLYPVAGNVDSKGKCWYVAVFYVF